MNISRAVLSATTDLLAGPYLLGVLIAFLGLWTVSPELAALGVVLIVGSLMSAVYLAWRE